MADATAKKGKPGPKPRGPFKNKRRTLTTKITESTRRNLEDAAAATGRSLSQEIEFRLDESLLEDDARRDREERAYGGAHTHALLRLLGDTIKGIEMQTSGTWTEDRYTFDQVRLGIQTFLDALRPPESDDDRPRLIDRLVDAVSMKKLPPRMVAEWKGLRNTIGAVTALGHLDQLKLRGEGHKPEVDHVRGDGLQLAYDTAPIIAPLIGRDKG